jgi:elongation factor P
MISTNQFKNGSHIELDGQVFRIVEFQHVKPGKGGAFVRSKLKNVGTGAVVDKTFRAGEKVRPVRTEVRRMQYLYESGDEAVMMDMSDYDQVPLAKSVIGDALDWMLPNDEVDVLFVDDKPSDVQIPSAIEMGVTQTDPGVRGDTASGGGNKPATLESGVMVQVPLFVNEGDRIRVDTRTREYVSRA